MFFSVHVLVL